MSLINKAKASLQLRRGMETSKSETYIINMCLSSLAKLTWFSVIIKSFPPLDIGRFLE